MEAGASCLCAAGASFRQIRCVCFWQHFLPTNTQLQGIHSGLILLFFSLTKGKNYAGRKTFTLKRIAKCRTGLTVPRSNSEDSGGWQLGQGTWLKRTQGLKPVVLPSAPDLGSERCCRETGFAFQLQMTDVIPHRSTFFISSTCFFFLLLFLKK